MCDCMRLELQFFVRYVRFINICIIIIIIILDLLTSAHVA